MKSHMNEGEKDNRRPNKMKPEEKLKAIDVSYKL